jgi:hypothetical protein
VRKAVIAGLAGIGALTAGSLLLLDLASRDGGPRAPGPSPAEPASPPPAPLLTLPPDYRPGQPIVVPDLGGHTAKEFDTMADRGPPRVVAPPGSWEAVPMSSSRSRAGDPVMAAVGRELNDLHDTLSGCYEPETAARQGAATYSRVVDEEATDDPSTTVLVLQLETQAGSVRVADAPVAASGGASDGTLACVQAALRGKVFEAPGARPGRRLRLQYRLIP